METHICITWIKNQNKTKIPKNKLSLKCFWPDAVLLRTAHRRASRGLPPSRRVLGSSLCLRPSSQRPTAGASGPPRPCHLPQLPKLLPGCSRLGVCGAGSPDLDEAPRPPRAQDAPGRRSPPPSRGTCTSPRVRRWVSKATLCQRQRFRGGSEGATLFCPLTWSPAP